MTYRIETTREPATAVTIQFEGVLDGAAIDELRAAVEAAVARGLQPRVLLRAGTAVDRASLDAVRNLRARITAESPYLERWLAGPSAVTRRGP